MAESKCWSCSNYSPLKCEWVMTSGKKLPKGVEVISKIVRVGNERGTKEEELKVIINCPNYKKEERNTDKCCEETAETGKKSEKYYDDLNNEILILLSKEMSIGEITEEINNNFGVVTENSIYRYVNKFLEKGIVEHVGFIRNKKNRRVRAYKKIKNF